MSRPCVLIVPEWYPWPDRPGEAPWAREQARAVTPHADVVVLAARREPLAAPRYRIEEGLEQGLRVVRIRYGGPGLAVASAVRLTAYAAALRRLARSGWRPDILHAHVFYSGVLCLLLARRRNVPVVISEHYTAFPRRLITGFGRWLAKIAFERAAIVCPDSEDLGCCIRALGIGGRYRHVPNVVDTSAFYPSAADRPPNEVKAVSVASLHEKKGHRDLLDAMVAVRERRPDVSVDVIGDGPLREELQTRAAELSVPVRFLGAKDKAGVAAAFREAAFHILPSHFENAPHALIEAMASGLPSVATRVGGIDEMLDEQTGVLVEAHRPAELAVAILRLAETAPTYNRELLVATARGRWGHERVGRLWLSIYRDEIERRARTRRHNAP